MFNDIQGWFKQSYADKIENLVPSNVYFAKEAKPLAAEQQPGGGYNVAVTLSSEQGMTKAQSGSGAFALNAPVAMSSRFATVMGSQFLLRSALDYESVYNSKNKNAFVAATKGVVENMLNSMWEQIEADCIYGGAPKGIVNAAAVLTITVTTASWASGLWLGSEGRAIRIESAAGVLRGVCNITSYDIEARQLIVDALPAGIIATDLIYYAADGAASANTMVGLAAASGVTTGLLWGLNRTTWRLWAPPTPYPVGGVPFSFNHAMRAITRATNHGLGDKITDIDLAVNPGAFTDLSNDMAALSTRDVSYKIEEGHNGSEKLTFHCPAGKVSVIQHRMIWESIAFVMPSAAKGFSMVGSCPKPDFALPGLTKTGEKEYLRPMENNAGVECRLYANTAIFTPFISKCLAIGGIVNS